jgi:hypothetical protein
MHNKQFKDELRDSKSFSKSSGKKKHRGLSRSVSFGDSSDLSKSPSSCNLNLFGATGEPDSARSFSPTGAASQLARKAISRRNCSPDSLFSPGPVRVSPTPDGPRPVSPATTSLFGVRPTSAASVLQHLEQHKVGPAMEWHTGYCATHSNDRILRPRPRNRQSPPKSVPVLARPVLRPSVLTCDSAPLMPQAPLSPATPSLFGLAASISSLEDVSARPRRCTEEEMCSDSEHDI